MVAAYTLVDRVATGDRAAFQWLCMVLSKRVWQTAAAELPHPLDARAVTCATFLEVWHLAGHHVNYPPAEVHGWITAIIARRVGERLRTLETPHMLLDDYDRHVHCELAALLGPDPRCNPTARTRGRGRLRLPRRLAVRRHP